MYPIELLFELVLKIPGQTSEARAYFSESESRQPKSLLKFVADIRCILMFSKWLAFQVLGKTNQLHHKMVCILQKCEENFAGKTFDQNCKCSCCQNELFTYN